ncbi:unnamed protein product [Pylaiella littoralis]
MSVSLPEKEEEKYDPRATALLTPELRKIFAALWVPGDGNCFWRAVRRALWGSDEYWCQLKLAVRGSCSVNVEALVGECGPLYLNGLHYEEQIHVRYVYRGADGRVDHKRDDYSSMLLENIGWFCANKMGWGPLRDFGCGKAWCSVEDAESC